MLYHCYLYLCLQRNFLCGYCDYQHGTCVAAAAFTRTALMLQTSAAAVAAATAIAVTVQALVVAAVGVSSSPCHDPCEATALTCQVLADAAVVIATLKLWL